jgi:hypothetical protein
MWPRDSLRCNKEDVRRSTIGTAWNLCESGGLVPGITDRYCGHPSRRPLRGLLRMRSNLLKHNNLMLRSERRERLEAWAASDSHIYDSRYWRGRDPGDRLDYLDVGLRWRGIAGGDGCYRNLPVLGQTPTAFARLTCFNGFAPSHPANNNNKLKRDGGSTVPSRFSRRINRTAPWFAPRCGPNC